MMSIATFFKGRISFKELIDLPADYINHLSKLAYESNNSQEGREAQQGEAIQDAMEDAGII